MSGRSILLLCLFISLGLTHGQINWAGAWDWREKPSTEACNPDNSILITQTAGYITASWTWETTEACTKAGLAGKTFNQTVENSNANSIVFTNISSTLTFEEATTDKLIFTSDNGASAAYFRRLQWVYWEGIWDIVTQEDSACNPEKFIRIVNSKTYEYYVEVSWTWANTEACVKYELAGKNFSDLAKASMANTLTLESVVGETRNQVAIFAVVGDEGVLSSVNGTSSSFMRRQEAVNFAGTWNMTDFDSTLTCFPTSTVNVIQAEGNVIASWKWENSSSCQFMGLNGTSFNQTQPTPKGKTLFIDMIPQGLQRMTCLFVVEGEKAKFIGSNGGAANFVKKQEDPNKPNSLLGWIIGAIVVVIIVVGVFCFVQNKKKKDIENDYRSADSAVMA